MVQGFTYTIDRKVGGVTVLQGRRIGRNLGKGRNLSHRMDTNDNSSYMRFSVTSDMPDFDRNTQRIALAFLPCNHRALQVAVNRIKKLAENINLPLGWNLRNSENDAISPKGWNPEIL